MTVRKCKYCTSEKIIFETEQYHPWTWSPEEKVTISEFEDRFIYNEIIFIDRGYLRVADKDDCNCMEHGERVKINYCPFCGNKIISEDK